MTPIYRVRLDKDSTLVAECDALDAALEAMRKSVEQSHVEHVASGLRLRMEGRRFSWVDKNGRQQVSPE